MLSVKWRPFCPGVCVKGYHVPSKYRHRNSVALASSSLNSRLKNSLYTPTPTQHSIFSSPDKLAKHYGDVTWTQMGVKSPVTWLIVQQLVQLTTINISHTTLRTIWEGNQSVRSHGKRVHGMMPSWFYDPSLHASKWWRPRKGWLPVTGVCEKMTIILILQLRKKYSVSHILSHSYKANMKWMP